MKSIKWLSVILSLILVLVLSGCHDGGETGANADTSEFISKNPSLTYLQPSLGITLKNIDPMSIHNTNPLGEKEKSFLRELGYTEEKIKLMDCGDYQEIFSRQPLDENAIKAARMLYPELMESDLTKWTYGQFDQYIEKKNDETYCPSPEEWAELQKRGITKDDARYLLNELGSYKTILQQSDESLKNMLISFYEFKFYYVEQLKKIEAENTSANEEQTKPLTSPAKEDDQTGIMQINQLSAQKCQMDFAGELKQGFNFVITYTLPETNYNLMKNHKITLKVEYPIEYFAVLGTSGSGISEIPKLTNYKPQTASMSFEAYPSNISEEDLEALLSKQYTFKVRSYIDDVLVKECDIQNTIQNI